MSTILDALRKLQRERDAAKRPDLDLRGSVVAAPSAPSARHRPLYGLLLIGVVTGMATGALLLYAYGWPWQAGDVDGEERTKATALAAPDTPRALASPPDMDPSPQDIEAENAAFGSRAPFAHAVPSDEMDREDEAVPHPAPAPAELPRARRPTPTRASAPEPTPDRSPVPAAEARPIVVGPTPSPPIRVGHIRWHPDPERREVSLELEDVRIPNAREGDIVSGVLVRRIDPDSVEIQIGSARRRVALEP